MRIELFIIIRLFLLWVNTLNGNNIIMFISNVFPPFSCGI